MSAENMRKFLSEQNPMLVEARKNQAMMHRVGTQAAVSGGFQRNQETSPFGPPRRIYADGILTASGNTTTYSASEGAKVSLLSESGWDDYDLNNSPTNDTTGATTDKKYDFFIWLDQSADPDVFILEKIAWTDETTRAVTLDTVDGARVKSTDNTWRYIGTGRYTGSSMLVSSFDNLGTSWWGTGDPYDPEGADPFTGTIANADGIYGYNAGVLQAYLRSADGAIGFGAGAGKLDTDGETLTAEEYPSSAHIVWKSDDNAAIVGRILGSYGGAAVNSYLILDGLAHDSGVDGGVLIRTLDHTGAEKGNFIFDFSFGALFDMTDTVNGQQLAVYAKTSDTNILKAILKLASRSSGTTAAGFGAAIEFYSDDSSGNDQNTGYIGVEYTDPAHASEDSRIAIGRMNAGALENGKIDWGTYTPTLFNTTNVAASTASVCQWMQVGKIVTVSGTFTVDPTSAVQTVLGISIPVASNFSSFIQLGGTAVSQGAPDNPAPIFGDGTNDRATARWTPTTNLGNQGFSFQFTYIVI
jgi:hypothetical protein